MFDKLIDMRRGALVAGAGLVLLGAGCGSDEQKTSDARIAVSVHALTLEGVSDAFYTLRVWNGASPPVLVWEEEHLSSQRFGDRRGSIAYVGPCDASPAPVNQNRIELELEKLVGPGGDLPADSYQNPAPVGSPLVLGAVCRENADTPVEFNLMIMRDADQGFFDVAVSFEDIFCSAKFDCLAEDDGPLELLHRPGGERDRTLVLGFACTAGGGETTWLHMSDVLIECGTAPDVTSYWVNPTQVPVGNAGGVDPIFYQTAIYRGSEDLPGIDKCYWNLAFGINEIPAAADCRLIASGTASHEPFAATQTTPANTIFPYVSFDIPITGADGGVMCGRNPMNGAGSQVTTRYTGFEGSRFAHSWQCGETPVTERLACAGQIDALGATFSQSPDGIAVAFGNSSTDPTSARFTLPAGLTLSQDCCMNPCCSDPLAPPAE